MTIERLLALQLLNLPPMDVSLTAWRSIQLGFSAWRQVTASLLLLGTLSWSQSAGAATPDTAPPELIELLAQIDAAANRHDLEAVMAYYSSELTHSDGLTHDRLEQAVAALWQRYPNASYQTELTNWEATDNGFVIETRTTIAGREAITNHQLTLNAAIASRQRIEGQTIIEQTILGEQSRLTSGNRPPTVNVTLPATVSPGSEFTFDAVVQEPLGDRLLLGTALEESVSAEAYTSTPPIEFELLNAGGVFKVGQAPEAGDRWISAVLVRDDGLTVVTQRLGISPSSDR